MKVLNCLIWSGNDHFHEKFYKSLFEKTWPLWLGTMLVAGLWVPLYGEQVGQGWLYAY